MIWFLSWLLVVELFGVAVLPLATRLFGGLPDRGYLFARPLGILLVSYLCWLPAMFGLLRFHAWTVGTVLLLVAAGCWWIWGRRAIQQLAPRLQVVLLSEALFLIVFSAAATIRAFNPEISGTEKPMDLAFLNSLYRGDSLPPEDPWMAGFSISYYYFGYLLIAAVAKVSAVPAAVAYNLGVALIFALTVTGSYSIALALISSLGRSWGLAWRMAASLLAPIMVAVMGNLEIVLEVMAARGLGSQGFWQWAGVKNLAPLAQPEGWVPTSHWWWWRASRVIPTTQPDGINEFPYFSFLLGDLHPHYMALPWGLLVVALALSVLIGRFTEKEDPVRNRVVAFGAALSLGFLMVGNSWDFPTYTALYWAVAVIPIFSGDGFVHRAKAVWKPLALTSLASAAMYSPFMLGFSSQTRGVGISADRTPLASMLIIFGASFAIVIAFLSWRAFSRRAAGSDDGEPPNRLPWIVGLGLIAASSVLGSLALLAGMLALAWYWWNRLREDPAIKPQLVAEGFLLIVVAGSLLLILGPEFLFIADLFGTRMNTVFKFHYQAWVLLGIAAAVSLAWMSREMGPRPLRWGATASLSLLVGAGLLYPVLATPAKAHDFALQPTLDGSAFYQDARPEDWRAIQWIASTTTRRPVVLEATGPDYSEYARVSTFSGLPTVIGWAGHEVQWRGDGSEPQRRTADVEAIYRTADPPAIPGLLAKYRVQYVIVGSLEIEKYGPGLASRFDGLLKPVYRQGGVTVYEVPGRG